MATSEAVFTTTVFGICVSVWGLFGQQGHRELSNHLWPPKKPARYPGLEEAKGVICGKIKRAQQALFWMKTEFFIKIGGRSHLTENTFIKWQGNNFLCHCKKMSRPLLNYTAGYIYCSTYFAIPVLSLSS